MGNESILCNAKVDIERIPRQCILAQAKDGEKNKIPAVQFKYRDEGNNEDEQKLASSRRRRPSKYEGINRM